MDRNPDLKNSCTIRAALVSFGASEDRNWEVLAETDPAKIRQRWSVGTGEDRNERVQAQIEAQVRTVLVFRGRRASQRDRRPARRLQPWEALVLRDQRGRNVVAAGVTAAGVPAE